MQPSRKHRASTSTLATSTKNNHPRRVEKERSIGEGEARGAWRRRQRLGTINDHTDTARPTRVARKQKKPWEQGKHHDHTVDINPVNRPTAHPFPNQPSQVTPSPPAIFAQAKTHPSSITIPQPYHRTLAMAVASIVAISNHITEQGGVERVKQGYTSGRHGSHDSSPLQPLHHASTHPHLSHHV